MTVTELAARVRKPRGTVAHHVDVLVDAGLLKVTATRRVRAIDERFYGRTAHTIIVSRFDERWRSAVRRRCPRRGRPVGVERRMDGTRLHPAPRHGSLPNAVKEFTERVMALATEFTRLPRGGSREYAFLAGVFPTNRPVAPEDPE